MRADRFGSYSMAATLAGIPSLSRLKSMIRYSRLCPPPRCRTVTRPCALRPPLFLSGSTSDRSGSVFVMSRKSATVMPRRPGDVGLYFFTAIAPLTSPPSEPLKDGDPLALLQCHDGLLAIGRPPDAPALAALLAPDADGVDLGHLHVKDGLHRPLDLGLVGRLVHLKHVLALLHQGRGLLGDEGPLDHVARIHYPNASSSLATAARVMTSRSWANTWYTLMSSACAVSAPGRLRADSSTLRFRSPSTIKGLRSADSRLRTLAISLVLGWPNWRSSSTMSSPARTFAERADRRAARRAFLGMDWRYSRGLGPNTTPPPTQIGERMLPCRARPRPFCRHGLRPPPRTSPRVLVDAVPWRWLARYVTTAWCSKASLTSAPKTVSDSSISPTGWPCWL